MKHDVPQNVGRCRVAMTLGNKWSVWNGKQGNHEFVIVCRDRKQAAAVCALINARPQPKEVDVPL